MPEEENPDRPRFRFKATEFERLNPKPGAKSTEQTSVVPPASVRADNIAPVLDRKTVLPVAIGLTDPSAARSDTGLEPNPDVYTLLRLNRARAEPHDPVPVLSPWRKRQRPLLNYLVAIVLIDGPLAALACHLGPTDPFIFVPLIAGMAYFTGWLTWNVWVAKV